MASNDTPTSAKERIHSPASSLKRRLSRWQGHRIAHCLQRRYARPPQHEGEPPPPVARAARLGPYGCCRLGFSCLPRFCYRTARSAPLALRAAAHRERCHRLGLPHPRPTCGTRQQSHDHLTTGTPIHARMAGLTFVCSVATHLAGNCQREGTAVQIGGTIASNVAQLFKLSGRDRKDLMLAGISAAFGGVFGTPLAGAFFGMEMCTLGRTSRTARVCIALLPPLQATAWRVFWAHSTPSSPLPMSPP